MCPTLMLRKKFSYHNFPYISSNISLANNHCSCYNENKIPACISKSDMNSILEQIGKESIHHDDSVATIKTTG